MTLVSVSALWVMSRRVELPAVSKRAINALMLMSGTQVLLGILALLSYVDIKIASIHQAGALTLFALSIWVMHSLRIPKTPFCSCFVEITGVTK
jgi:cytochrome c oxidase assembly protein subunit 15